MVSSIGSHGVTLKVHCIESYTDGRGVTKCGEPFFKGRISNPHCGDFEAERRIGGIRAIHASRFEPDKYACKKCIEAWAN